MKLIHILLAIFLPPLSVLLSRGLSMQLLLNIVLTMLGVLPGSIHAIWLLTTQDESAPA